MVKKAVCALIRKGNLVLGVSRKDDPNDFGLPGGKVDPGEFPEKAVIREVLEETGLRVCSVGQMIYEAENTGYQCLTYVVNVEGEIDHDSEAGVVKWVEPFVLEQGSFGEYNRDLFRAYPVESMISQKRQEEIRTIIQSLRVADETGELAPNLYADAQYALLDLLDRVKVTLPPPSYFDDFE